MKYFLYILLFSLISACVTNERATGYKASPDNEGYLVQICDEEEIINSWWSFETENAVVNTLAPSYEDYCAYVSESYVFMWNTVEEYGYYNNGWAWYCKNENTLTVIDTDSGADYSVKIYGKMETGDHAGCYDVKITNSGLIINGYVCPCEYNGP